MSIVNLEERDDEQLMALIVQQSREALESLYDWYSRAVYSLAVSLLRDPGAAEEVTQDVFLSVWRRGASYRPRGERLRPGCSASRTTGPSTKSAEGEESWNM